MSITRRSMIKALPLFGAGAVAFPSASLAASADLETAGLSGLTLAAVHIERAIQAMADVEMGRWSVKIVSGDASQSWAFHQEFNRVQRAIWAHKRCYAATDALLDEVYAIESALFAKPTYDIMPKVQVGRLLKGRDPEGNDIWEPIYAYDLATVDRHSADWQRAFSGWRPDNAESARVRFAQKRDDLRKAIARKKKMEQRAGLTAKRKALRAAYEAQDRAAVVVLVVRPGSAEEAAERRAYIKSANIGQGYDWDADELLPIMLSIVEDRDV